MDNKLKCIMLVDDNDADNFIHRMIIEASNCTELVVEVFNGAQALAYLKEHQNTEKYPDLIFLDINMPLMDGWEFIDAYEAENLEDTAPAIIVMLTTSLNPDDAKRAKSRRPITDFCNKPLDAMKLDSILNELRAA